MMRREVTFTTEESNSLNVIGRIIKFPIIIGAIDDGGSRTRSHNGKRFAIKIDILKDWPISRINTDIIVGGSMKHCSSEVGETIRNSGAV